MLRRAFSLYVRSFSGLSRSIWLLALVNFINRSGTMVLPFLTIYLTVERGFTLGQAGWAMSSFGFGSMAGSYLGGRLTDKLGFYKVQFWSLLLGGVGFLLLYRMDTPWEVYSMVFVISTISESFRPANIIAVTAYARPENHTRSYSLLRLSFNLGWTTGPALGGWMAVKYGYFTLFIADGLTCIAAAFVLHALLAPKKNPEEDGQKQGSPRDESAGKSSSPYRNRPYLFLLLITLFGVVAFMQLLSSLPVFYKQVLSFTEGEIGLLMAYNGLLIVLVEMPIVYVLERRYHVLDCIIAGTVLYLLSFWVLNLPLWPVTMAIISMTALTFGEILNMPFTNTYAMSLAPPSRRGQYIGLYTMMFAVGLILAPTIGMQIADRLGFTTLWWVMGGLCALSVAGLYLLRSNRLPSVN